jgi:hypothetical protein
MSDHNENRTEAPARMVRASLSERAVLTAMARGCLVRMEILTANAVSAAELGKARDLLNAVANRDDTAAQAAHQQLFALENAVRERAYHNTTNPLPAVEHAEGYSREETR